MKIAKVLSLIVLLFFISSSIAQTRLAGNVSNSKSKPIAKALIYLDSINSNVKTDKRGYFEVMVPETVKDVNVFSHKYGLLSSPFNGERKMDFIFIDGKKSAKERMKESDYVTLDYDDVEKKYIAIKVESLDASNQIDTARFRNIYDLLRNRLTGVRITSDNKIIIRGVSSIISSQDPLFVVDGTIVSSIDHILPVDVDKVSVIKDSGASMYGSRGANGVILITTKKQ